MRQRAVKVRRWVPDEDPAHDAELLERPIVWCGVGLGNERYHLERWCGLDLTNIPRIPTMVNFAQETGLLPCANCVPSDWAPDVLRPG